MTEHISAAEYREMKPKSLKYHNQKTVVDGRMFDSQKEANYYCELKLLKQAGEITDFLCQVDFVVHDGYYQGLKWIKPIYYRADFVVDKICLDCQTMDPKLIREIHETKGKWTRSALDKRKMFEKRYREYKFLVI